MNLLSFFKPRSSAPVARERLQILLAHERALSGRPGITAVLQEEILAVIARHFPIDRDKVQVKLDSASGVSTLEIDIEMPDLPPIRPQAAAPTSAKKPEPSAAKPATLKTPAGKPLTPKPLA